MPKSTSPKGRAVSKHPGTAKAQARPTARLTALMQSEIDRRVSLAVAALDDVHDRAWGNNSEGIRDRFTYDREDILRQCLDAWRANPLARRIVSLVSQYVVGAGVLVESEHAPTQKFIKRWWEHRLNRMDTRVFEWCDELSRSGELFVLLSTDGAGMSYLRAVPALEIQEIDHAPNDIEQPTQFTQKATTPGEKPTFWPAYDEDTDEGEGTVMLHYAINRPVGAQRGESDLAPALKWLSRHAAWLEDRARLNRFRQAFMYDVSANFPTETARKKREAEIHARPPEPGSVLVHDVSEKWEVISPKLDSGEAGQDGLAIKKMIATAGGIPLHFLAEPESSTRTTAESAGGPTYRHYQQRQIFFLWLMKDIAKIVVKRRAMYDRHVKGESELKARGTDISARDNAALAVAAGQIVAAFSQLYQAGLLPKEEFIRLAYTFAGEIVSPADILADAPGVPMPITPSQTKVTRPGDVKTQPDAAEPVKPDTSAEQGENLARHRFEQTATPNVTIYATTDAAAITDAIQSAFAALPAAQVTVNLPEQAAPIIPPAQVVLNVPPTQVMLTAPPPQITNNVILPDGEETVEIIRDPQGRAKSMRKSRKAKGVTQ